MKLSFTSIAKDTKRDNGLLPLVVGQPNFHVMDWNGCSFHHVQLPGWKRGKRLANTPRNQQILKALLKAVNNKALTTAIAGKNGTFLSEYESRYELV